MENIVSIIIPHFNRSTLLKKTIRSVKEQSFKSWEIFIVDDGSDEPELSEIKGYETEHNIKVIQRKGGIKGPSSCRNLGVEMSKGKYLIFLDSDDLLAPFCLEQRIKIMEDNSDVQLAIFKMEEFSSTPGDKGSIFNREISKANWTASFIRNENPWNVTCPVWRKGFFESIGGFDEELLFMEDPELHVRAVNYPNAEIKICYDKPVDCYYRINHMDDTKKDFWFNSIFYRLLFYRKMFSESYPQSFIVDNADNIKRGIYSLVKNFLYSRKNDFPHLYTDLISFMKDSRVFSSYEISRVTFLINVGNTQYWIIRKLRIRGLCNLLLPVK